MAIAPYKFIDRRGSANAYSSNLLIPSATPNKDRETIPRLDYDVHRNVSALGRRVLLSAGRRLYSGNSIVRAAINEQATYSVSTFQPQFYGENKDWGSQAEDYLADNDKFVDLRGPPYNMSLFRRNLIVSVLRDGDVGIILTEDSAGAPKIQIVPAHRIGPWNQYSQQIVQGGPYDGARMIDGVIVNEYGAAMAYRVMGENSYDSATFQDVPANSMILAFIPDYPDQLRGFSVAGTGLYTWQDLAEIDYHTRMGHKVSSRTYIVEKNPTGTLDKTKQLLKSLDRAPDETTQQAQSLAQEIYDDGNTRYFKSGTGSGLEILNDARPSTEAQAFKANQTRQVMAGMGWSYDFTVDPTGPGGAQMRIVIEKINRTVEALQEYVAEPTIHRIDGYRVAKGIKNGFLPPDPDWWKWTYQGPQRLTADAKYDSDIDLQENRAGIKPLRKISAARGGWWEDDQDQLIAEEKRLQEKCAEAGVDPNRISLKTPNGNAQIEPAQPGGNPAVEPDGDEPPKGKKE